MAGVLSLELTPRARSLRCSADRSIPTNSAVREMLPPKRLTWARRYSRSKISRASRKGSDIGCSPPAPFGDKGTGEMISSGSISAVMMESGSPPTRIISRSMLLRKLAHCARPVVRLQHRHGVLADAASRQAGGHRDGLHEIAHELGHVLTS